VQEDSQKRGGIMKQHITWEQLTQLTYQQVSKLQILVNQKYHIIESEEHWEKIKNYTFTFMDKKIINMHTSYIGFIEKTTIGKMIEMIEILGLKLNGIYVSPNHEYLVTVDDEKSEWCKNYKNKELSDALWEAVKEIL